MAEHSARPARMPALSRKRCLSKNFAANGLGVFEAGFAVASFMDFSSCWAVYTKWKVIRNASGMALLSL